MLQIYRDISRQMYCYQRSARLMGLRGKGFVDDVDWNAPQYRMDVSPFKYEHNTTSIHVWAQNCNHCSSVHFLHHLARSGNAKPCLNPTYSYSYTQFPRCLCRPTAWHRLRLLLHLFLLALSPRIDTKILCPYKCTKCNNC